MRSIIGTDVNFFQIKAEIRAYPYIFLTKKISENERWKTTAGTLTG
jgi:hypothetical protein